MRLRQAISRPSFVANKLKEEQGSVLIISLLILAVLAMLGAVASNMSITEMQSSANERNYNQSFYAADSGWQEPVSMLNSLGDDPPAADLNTNVVDLSALDTTPNTVAGIPYNYTITYRGNRKKAGFGDDYREFQYQIDSTARGQQLRVVLNKPFAIN